MTPQEKIDVIRAQEDGKKIQVRSILSRQDSSRHNAHYYADWSDRHMGGRFDFNFVAFKYRIKPSPREWLLTERALYSGDIINTQRPAFYPGINTLVKVREVP